MITLQELITRGRFIMARAPERLRVFELVDSRRTAKDIATTTNRHPNSVRRDLTSLLDVGLIRPRTDADGAVMRDRMPIYEKVPLARTISVKYFDPVGRRPGAEAGTAPQPGDVDTTEVRGASKRHVVEIAVPSETEMLAIATSGEDQIYEFKAQRTEVRKIVREIAAMLNTKRGGVIFYGIDDDGNTEGSDVTRQKLDQPLQNSIKNSISPAATVTLHTVSALGSDVVAIITPPWNRRDVYQFDEKILIRKGTNVFAAKPEEVKRLHRGEYVI